jgi:DNA-binding transcriptional LysR family regulator
VPTLGCGRLGRILDVDRLRVFREVARLGSFTAAARRLSFTQPGVSHHVKQLERELGVTLLERSPRGVRLTPPGRTLLAHADAVLLRLADAERDTIEVARQGGGRLSLVSFPTGAATVVPPAVAAFRQQLPGVRVELAEADPPVSLPRLAAGEIDLAVAYHYPILQQTHDPTLNWEELFADGMAVCLHRDHELADADEIALEQLSDAAFAAPYDCACRDALLQACRDSGFTPRVVTETNDYMAMQGLVASGVGVAVMPRLVASIAIRPEVVLRPLPLGTLTRVVAVVSRRAGFRSHASTQMQELLHQAASTLATPGLPLKAPFGLTTVAAAR